MRFQLRYVDNIVRIQCRTNQVELRANAAVRSVAASFPSRVIVQRRRLGKGLKTTGCVNCAQPCRKIRTAGTVCNHNICYSLSTQPVYNSGYNSRTVSYTHLDVYKRQDVVTAKIIDLDWDRNRISLSMKAALPESVHETDAGDTDSAVSYTHLVAFAGKDRL